MAKKIKASVVGASGYSGFELLRILARHPSVEIDKVFANSSAGKTLEEVYPWFRNHVHALLESFTHEAVSGTDVVFFALPSGEAMNLVPELVHRGKKVIDLGADFRLKDVSLYEKSYNHKHTAAKEVANAVYGLPEWNKEQIQSASLIANPGCYPTSAIIPLAPVLKERLIESRGISVSSMSGVSGAGRNSSFDLSFVEVNNSVKAYKVGNHQHIPEINTALETIVGKTVSVTFVPHLIPITRGIYTSTYATLAPQVTETDVMNSYRRYYESAPFVRFSETSIPEIKHVVNTNFIDIGFRLYPENNQLIILSVIDNLIKGAAGQAVQNMNLLFGYNESEGLL